MVLFFFLVLVTLVGWLAVFFSMLSFVFLVAQPYLLTKRGSMLALDVLIFISVYCL